MFLTSLGYFHVLADLEILFYYQYENKWDLTE